jgi:gliding motility-associated-like protein
MKIPSGMASVQPAALTKHQLVVNASTPMQLRQSQTTNNCNTSTFYLDIPAPAGNKISVAEIEPLPTGDFIISGTLTNSSNEDEGLLIRLSNSGNVVAQTTLKVNNHPVKISAGKVQLNGQVVIAGIVNDGSNNVFVAQLNDDFSVNWTELFATSSTPLKLTLDLQEDDDMGFAVQLVNSIVYYNINTDGSINWAKETPVTGLRELVGFGMMRSYLPAIVANCTIAGKSQTVLYEIDYTTGNVISGHYLENGGSETSALYTSSFGSRMKLLHITKTSTGYELRRDNLPSAAQAETRHSYTLPSLDLAISARLDRAGDAIGICLPAQGKMLFVKQFADYNEPLEFSTAYTVPTGSTLETISRSFDGGFIFGLNAGGTDKITLIKTDSTGVLSGCGYSSINCPFNEVLNVKNPTNAYSNVTITPQVVPGIITASIASLPFSFACKQNYCPLPPVQDTCLSTFFKLYRSNSYVDEFEQYHLMAANKHLVVSRRYDHILGITNQLTKGIKVFDANGEFIKGVNVYSEGVSASFTTRKVDSDKVMLVTYSPLNGIPRFNFTLINTDLQVLWSKSIQTYQGYEFLSEGLGFADLHRDDEGNYYFLGTSPGYMNTKPGVIIYKMDPSGNPLWVKAWQMGDGTFGTAKIVSTKTSLILIIEGGQPQGSVSASLDKITGQMTSAWIYQNSWAGSVYNRVAGYENGRIFYGGNDAKENFAMALFDTTGKPTRFRIINIPNSASEIRAGIIKNSSLYANYEYFNGTGFKNVVLKTDSLLNIDFYNEYPVSKYGYATGMGVDDMGNIYLGGNTSGNNFFDPFLTKYGPRGESGTCPYTATTAPLVDVDVKPMPLAFTEIVRSLTQVNIPVSFTPDAAGQQVSQILCSSVPQCNYLKLSAPSRVCHLAENFSLQVQKNAACTLQPQWITDTSALSLVTTTDTSATFITKKAGKVWIKARLNAGCSFFTDSVSINIYSSPVILDAGSDTSICAGNQIILNAHEGFASYKWQDGSADSIYTAKAAGSYWVEGTTGCGVLLRDTVIISDAPPVPVDIGPDRTRCMNDTLQLVAPAGFITYKWTDSHNYLVGNAAAIVLKAATDNAYYLQAERTRGCFGFDTVAVKVYAAPLIDLGKDTSFCQGSRVTLDAGSGFSSYLWSTGSTQQKITASATGNYSVKAFTKEGCNSADTIRVLNVYNNPVVSLDHNGLLCAGSARVLNAGNFSSYLWNDGSSSGSKVVRDTGSYRLIVTDAHGCSGSDSVHISSIVALPSAFLPSDTSICAYSKINVSSRIVYQRYLWSTSSTAASITVSTPGTYWLEVEDANNCTGRDSTIISPKECMAGIYVPTAFTPNKDGRNDVFRPLLYGNVKKYVFSIYNRWGQLVFQSNELQKGWDGKLAGQEQRTDVYVWICNYQLEGEPVKLEKGSVTLIR